MKRKKYLYIKFKIYYFVRHPSELVFLASCVLLTFWNLPFSLFLSGSELLSSVMPNIYSELYSYYLFIYIVASPRTRPHSKSSMVEASRYFRVYQTSARAPSDCDVTHSNDANSVREMAVPPIARNIGATLFQYCFVIFPISANIPSTL